MHLNNTSFGHMKLVGWSSNWDLQARKRCSNKLSNELPDIILPLYRDYKYHLRMFNQLYGLYGKHITFLKFLPFNLISKISWVENSFWN